MNIARFEWRDLAAIAVGGVVGAGLRWWITQPPTADDGGWFEYAPNTSLSFDPAASALPWETLLANGIGCLVLGITTALLLRSVGPRRWLVAVGTGFCGSLTTFSTFAVEIASRLRGRVIPAAEAGFASELVPERAAAITYLVLSALLGALAFVAGRFLARNLGEGRLP